MARKAVHEFCSVSVVKPGVADRPSVGTPALNVPMRWLTMSIPVCERMPGFAFSLPSAAEKPVSGSLALAIQKELLEFSV